jgi:endonuclease YncB( thermonuclease family)
MMQVRFHRYARVAFAAFAITQCAVAADSRDAGQVNISGSALVRDGDTLDIAGHRLRLYGVDAPELDQSCRRRSGASWRCGTAAKAALENLVQGQSVDCTQKDIDRYRRVVAVCRAGNQDINAALASAGWALAYREYSQDYSDEEQTARAAGRGVWDGTFEYPWDYRNSNRAADNRAATSSATPDSANCKIKGNISSGGDRIYHVAGGEFYDRTRIDTAAGERWFCTEREATGAGWRKSRQ